ncbi:fumarylacetoacetase [Dactylonectria macrodidyma]|uniref:Fumarylacetoacetase n=1 Tax=Dactylonectria macrodidyma TaxID=307937 RepID=A0A9P9FLC5_9HYPO|nr:fumarylacetoacetase [Dactylonectria macrodidyma]
MSYAEHFSLKNIPYGIASTKDRPAAVVTRLHDFVFFLSDLNLDASGNVKNTFSQNTLNALASIDKNELKKLRTSLQAVLEDQNNVSKFGTPAGEVVMHLPVEVKGFTDFSCSSEHLLNAGEAVLGVRSFPPASLHLPIGYTGRSSSVIVSGTSITRPYGQYRDGEEVGFGPSRAVDYELEMGAIIGKPSAFGDRVSVNDADKHIFGLVILNDWSARDIQGFEMQPLGPLNGKSFGTSISPWVVTLEALEPFATEPPAKQSAVKAYLQDKKAKSSYNIKLSAEVLSEGSETNVCKAQLQWISWTFRDLVAQQTINGCNINTGDLLATGTVSGVGDDEHGCLLEMTRGGKVEWELSNGKKRRYLEDGDGVRLTACAGEGVGFGDCTGFISAAKPF